MVVDTYEYLFTNTQHHFNELLNSASHQERASTRIKTAIDECRSCVEQVCIFFVPSDACSWLMAFYRTS